MNIILFISNAVAFAFLLIYHMHMYQLNSYNNIEEKTWMRENSYPIFGRIFGLVISKSSLLKNKLRNFLFAYFITLLYTMHVASSESSNAFIRISLKFFPYVDSSFTDKNIDITGIIFMKNEEYIILLSSAS